MLLARPSASAILVHGFHTATYFRQGHSSQQLPPNLSHEDDLKRQKRLTADLDSACQFDETTGKDQLQWTTSSYHEDGSHSSLLRPPVPRKKHITVSLNAFQSKFKTTDDSEMTALLFPGQGSQVVGMGRSAVEQCASARNLFDRASHILGYDLLKICLEGPKETLDRTIYCQPAVFVTSLAAVELLYANKPQFVRNCVSAAGFSVGEITALVFSGAISFDDGVRLIKTRASAMQQASEAAPSGMVTVFHGVKANLGLAMSAAKKWAQEHHANLKPVCSNANYLYPEARVIAGHMECLHFVDQNREDFGIRKLKFLPVSGAFHTDLMFPAVGPFAQCWEDVNVLPPRIQVYSNVTGKAYRSVEDIRHQLPLQLIKPVKWLQVMNAMFCYKDLAHLPKIIECGSGNSLVAILQKINGKIASRAATVSVSG